MFKIDYSHSGGFPLEQHVLDKMQSAYYETLKAFLGYLKIPEAGKFVLAGCEIVGVDIMPGMLYIDGDLCDFAGAVGTAATKIKKATITETASFENGTAIAVFSNTIAQINEEGTALGEFTRFYPVSDKEYVHTDKNFTQALYDKLFGIQSGAQVNVLSNWLAAIGTPGYIENKPTPPIVLRSGSSFIGDIGGEDQFKVISFPDVGTSNYHAIVTIMSESTGLGGYEGWNVDNDISWIAFGKASNQFKLGFHDYIGSPQTLRVDYTLLAF